jgi:cytochrome c oxidase cbb3-type subunit 3/ubiquinol-cytochrome c reductase cytochrome c subunit
MSSSFSVFAGAAVACAAVASRVRLVVLSLGLCLAARQASAQQVASTAAIGKGLYAKYCQLCHAAGGTGYAADNAPSLVSPMFLTAASDAFVARGIRLGRPNTSMAAYGKNRGGPLDDAQIDAIVAYLRSLGPRAIALPERKVGGSAARGAKLFERECRSCHGSAAQAGKAPQLHNPEFLAAASPAFLRHSILHGRPPTRMPAFQRRLSSTQVDDLVAWLGSLPAQTAVAEQADPIIPDDLPLLRHPGGKEPTFSLREDRFVSAEQVEQALAAKQRFIIIDARSPADWLQTHIPGALPIPYYDAKKLDRLPNDGTWVIAYCACPHHASGEVVDALRRRNFPHTAVLDEGILFWRQHGYPLEGAAAPVGAPPPP